MEHAGDHHFHHADSVISKAPLKQKKQDLNTETITQPTLFDRIVGPLCGPKAEQIKVKQPKNEQREGERPAKAEQSNAEQPPIAAEPTGPAAPTNDASTKEDASSAASTLLKKRAHTHARLWTRTFILNDPRRQIHDYFRPGDDRGPLGYLESRGWHANPDVPTSQFFSVWRPTSMISLQMMMSGTATGKGLNIKGKSAKEGELSGLVPFVQISEESHKKKIGTPPANARIQVFFQSISAREKAVVQLGPLMGKMAYAGLMAKGSLSKWKEGTLTLDDSLIESLCGQESSFQITTGTDTNCVLPDLVPISTRDCSWD